MFLATRGPAPMRQRAKRSLGRNKPKGGQSELLHGMTNHAAAEGGAGARHEPKAETQGGRLFVFLGKNDVAVGKKVTVCFHLRRLKTDGVVCRRKARKRLR